MRMFVCKYARTHTSVKVLPVCPLRSPARTLSTNTRILANTSLTSGITSLPLTYTYTHTYTHTHTRARTHTHTHARTHTHAHTHTHTHSHTHTYIHTYIRTCIHTYIRTHTHTPAPRCLAESALSSRGNAKLLPLPTLSLDKQKTLWPSG